MPNIKTGSAKDRTRNKIEEACGWAFATCSSKEQVISKAKIDKKLGRSNDNLGNYLRNKLLVCTNHHTQFFEANADGSKQKGIAKMYILNHAGYRELMNLLDGNDTATEIPTAKHKKTRECLTAYLSKTRTEHAEELSSLTFKMEQKGECPRLFHDLQYLSKESKAVFWDEKLPFNYDIQSCAPTLIYQQAQQLGLKGDFAAIETLIENPKAFRDGLAERNGITYKQAKLIINALFCGATLGRGYRFELFRVVNCSYGTMNLLRDDAWIIALREEIKACWKIIAEKGHIPRRKNKKGNWMPLRCTAKWNYYFKLERLVLDEIMSYLNDQGISFFPEHDGFRTSVPVDLARIEYQISGALAFNIKIAQDRLTSTSVDHLPDTSGVMCNPELSLPGKQVNSYAPVTYESKNVLPNNNLLLSIAYDDDLLSMRNDRGHYRNGKSGVKGVHAYSQNGQERFFAHIEADSERKYLGSFDTAEEAAQAYDMPAVRYFGEFARTNKDMGLL